MWNIYNLLKFSFLLLLLLFRLPFLQLSEESNIHTHTHTRIHTTFSFFYWQKEEEMYCFKHPERIIMLTKMHYLFVCLLIFYINSGNSSLFDFPWQIEGGTHLYGTWSTYFPTLFNTHWGMSVCFIFSRGTSLFMTFTVRTKLKLHYKKQILLDTEFNFLNIFWSNFRIPLFTPAEFHVVSLFLYS